jgi:CO/xanthine dehydrogenase Mo-binding subunit
MSSAPVALPLLVVVFASSSTSVVFVGASVEFSAEDAFDKVLVELLLLLSTKSSRGASSEELEVESSVFKEAYGLETFADFADDDETSSSEDDDDDEVAESLSPPGILPFARDKLRRRRGTALVAVVAVAVAWATATSKISHTSVFDPIVSRN